MNFNNKIGLASEIIRINLMRERYCDDHSRKYS